MFLSELKTINILVVTLNKRSTAILLRCKSDIERLKHKFWEGL